MEMPENTGQPNRTGWKTTNMKSQEVAKIYKNGGFYSIAGLRNGEKAYLIDDFPQLSESEETLIGKIVEKYNGNSLGSARQSLELTLNSVLQESNLDIDDEQKRYIVYITEKMISGFGFISSILSNDNIEEIAIIGLGSSKPVYVYEKNFGWLRTNAFFTDETTVKNLVNRMAQQLDRHITMQQPRLNAVLPDGSRLPASFPPVSFQPLVTLRKFREKPFTPPELVMNNTITAEAMAFLWMALQTDCSVLIAGNTGSGKTTLMNALFAFVPENERIVITEETPEINLPHRHIAKVHVAESINVGMRDLIVDTLRMRPDRVVIGEVRNSDEVGAFMETLLAGQGKGCYCTFHSRSAEEALARLRKLGIPDVDLPAIDLIIIQKRWSRISDSRNRVEERRTTQICEVVAGENGAMLNELFGFSFERNRLVKRNESTKISEKIMQCFGMKRAELAKELAGREKWLKEKIGESPDIHKFFSDVNEI